MPLGSSSAAPVTTPGPIAVPRLRSLRTALRRNFRRVGLDLPSLPSAARMLRLQPVTEALSGKLARRIARQAERLGNRRAEQGIPERAQHQRQGAFGNMMVLMADGQLRHQAANRIENRV